MCKDCDNHRSRSGYTESVKFQCGFCYKPIQTEWKLWGGMLHGPYTLIGDMVFHEHCAEVYLRPLHERSL